jgi:prepilin-type N-terminal cleavage/methylation domain-containing protein
MPRSARFHLLKIRRRQGFSLIELLIVVAILGILSAIAVPNFLRARESAKYAWFQATGRTIASSLEVYAATHKNRYPIDGIGYEAPGGDATRWKNDSGLEWIGTSNQNQDPSWKIDYDVHGNNCPGMTGTSYVALVFRGIRDPSPATVISGNCDFRARYGKGEAIPNEDGRLFVIHESVINANICPDSTCN